MGATAEKMEEMFELVPFDGVLDNMLRGYTDAELVTRFCDDNNPVIKMLCHRINLMHNGEEGEMAELRSELQEARNDADAAEEGFDSLKSSIEKVIGIMAASGDTLSTDVHDAFGDLIINHDLGSDIDSLEVA